MISTIREMVKAFQGELILGDPKQKVMRASVDSRLVKPGDLFFALKGAKVDGHQFLGAAFRQGAVGAVVSRLDWMKDQKSAPAVIRVANPQDALRALAHVARRSFKGPVVGITGSNGKTTTKQMVASVLRTTGAGLFTRGNFNSRIGLPLVLSELEPHDKWMALEMGASAPGDVAALAEMAEPTVGIITSIGPAHLETFGSLKKVAESKWELMDSLPSDGCAILPWGEPQLEPHIRAYNRRIVYFGEDPSCPVRASAIETGEKVRFVMVVGGKSLPVRLPLPGRCNVSNALAAAAAGWVLGIPLEKIAEGLETFEPPKMRMEVIHHPSGSIIINDAYNANPASMTQSVRTLAESYPDKKRVLVLGSMLELGEDSGKHHFHLGTELGRFSVDQVFLMGKETDGVKEGAVSVGAPDSKFRRIDNVDEMVEELRGHLRGDTVILFKASRGIALERILDPLLLPGILKEKQ